MAAIPTNALFALTSAASWGGGDFSGGMGVKAAGGTTTAALRLVLVAHSMSLAVLLVLLWVVGSPSPHGALLAWGLGAGAAAGISLTAFYIALSRGAMGASAAVSGLLAAAIPVVVSTVIEGRASMLRIAGFSLAMAAIWLIAAGPSDASGHAKTMGLAVIGGLGFGFYFVALRMDNPLGAFEPMALCRIASVVTCGLLLGFVQLRTPGSADQSAAQPKSCLDRTVLGWAILIALLDTGGNILFVAATRLGRLDVAAVLASLYPASTILLAAWRLHERPSQRQVIGMVLAIVAVVMITV